jgi:hypothetical protein
MEMLVDSWMRRCVSGTNHKYRVGVGGMTGSWHIRKGSGYKYCDNPHRLLKKVQFEYKTGQLYNYFLGLLESVI